MLSPAQALLVNAAAQVSILALPLQEVVADLIQLLDLLLNPLRGVRAAALVPVAALAGEVVIADLVELLDRLGLAHALLLLADLAVGAGLPGGPGLALLLLEAAAIVVGAVEEAKWGVRKGCVTRVRNKGAQQGAYNL